jgi:hypothetical protein
MNPNDARIRRIYTRKVGETIVDETLTVTDANELVVEWEAGSVLNSLAVDLDLIIVTRNVNTNVNTPATANTTLTVTTNGAPANTPYTQVITIPANDLTTNTIYESIGCLVRAASQIHSFSNWWLFLGI